jgi:hypothetical protein
LQDDAMPLDEGKGLLGRRGGHSSPQPTRILYATARRRPGWGCPNSQVLGPLGLRACGLPQRPCSRAP